MKRISKKKLSKLRLTEYLLFGDKNTFVFYTNKNGKICKRKLKEVCKESKNIVDLSQIKNK
jgi:hypothetical protein